ncbi:MAG TPA: class I SAM-dependent methyltransferase [Candidatus Acidoferrum sp.]|nr:class I SAM-dependent methyltransferase [Candidatus Acidoferrum sp.]
MNPDTARESAAPGDSPIENYYRLHSHIYDATRWTFLFGRLAILREAAVVARPARILEVGCGTGKNLVNLRRLFPESEVTGVDLSETMLDVARRKTAALGSRVRLVHGAYGPTFQSERPVELILFSYALSMFNPGFAEAIATARRDLAPGGHIAVVDFHDTRLSFFERWMGVNHVRMNGQLEPLLTAQFEGRSHHVKAAYGGVWRYLLFVGQKSVESQVKG